MARRYGSKKRHRKSSKRAAAARKGWRTRRRGRGAHHYPGRGHARRRGGHKSAKRVAAGRKAWRTKVRRYGSKAAAIRASFGRRRAAAPRRGRRKDGTSGYLGKAERIAAGKKAWRTKVRRYGSKAAALRHSFGRRGR